MTEEGERKGLQVKLSPTAEKVIGIVTLVLASGLLAVIVYAHIAHSAGWWPFER